MSFTDAPDTEELKAIIRSWHQPEPPPALKKELSSFGADGEEVLRQRLSQLKNRHYKSRLEVMIIGWLYDFIRANIKRGRLFDLNHVLQRHGADCLGYAKLFTVLGRLPGLDAGVIEVVIDNGGRYVPHTAVLVRLSNHRRRFVDFWYGSKNIRHRRLGLQVKQGGTWIVRDVDFGELSSFEDVCYLPDSCVDAITLYIRGNRYLNKRDYDSAIRCYSQAIELYPGNARLYYNRAIAYENLGDTEKAKAAYAQALADEASVTRVLAREHEEVTSLLNLDARDIDDLAQQIYLLHKGFVTGKEIPLARIAHRFGMTEAAAILSATETKIR